MPLKLPSTPSNREDILVDLLKKQSVCVVAGTGVSAALCPAPHVGGWRPFLNTLERSLSASIGDQDTPLSTEFHTIKATLDDGKISDELYNLLLTIQAELLARMMADHAVKQS